MKMFIRITICLFILSVSYSNGQKPIEKIYFIKEEVIGNKGIEEMENLFESNYKKKVDFLEYLNVLNAKDSLIIKSIDNETFRYEYENGQIMNLIKIDGNSGNLKFFGDFELTQIRNEIKLFKDAPFVEVQVLNNLKKKILGYNCFKVIISFQEKNEGVDLGKSIFEMFVTEKIKLPIHSLLYIPKLINDFFPLEVVRYEEKISNAKTYYRAYKIEH